MITSAVAILFAVSYLAGNDLAVPGHPADGPGLVPWVGSSVP